MLFQRGILKLNDAAVCEMEGEFFRQFLDREEPVTSQAFFLIG